MKQNALSEEHRALLQRVIDEGILFCSYQEMEIGAIGDFLSQVLTVVMMALDIMQDDPAIEEELGMMLGMALKGVIEGKVPYLGVKVRRIDTRNGQLAAEVGPFGTAKEAIANLPPLPPKKRVLN